MPSLDQYQGCLLGLATGDALGAPHEGGPIERLMWRMIGRTRAGEARWTDDTQMALDLAESLLAHGGVSQHELALQFARSYTWTRGYGPGAAKILKRIRRGQPWNAVVRAVYPGGSYGNGAAMRAPVLALFYPGDRAALVAAAQNSAEVTHAHPLAKAGATIIAVAVQAFLRGASSTEALSLTREACTSDQFHVRIDTAESWLQHKSAPDPETVAARLGNGITAVTSCITALYVAARHLDRPFEEMSRFAIAGGGDVDTISAMAGAMWGVVNGCTKLPAVALEERARIEEMASLLHARAMGG